MPLRFEKRRPPGKVRWEGMPGAAAAQAMGADANRFVNDALRQGNRVTAETVRGRKVCEQFYAMKKEYNAALARAKTPANRQKLMELYKARRRDLARRASAESAKAREAAARAAAQLNMRPLGPIGGAPRKRTARALADLVGVLEDVLRMSGYSLSELLRTAGADYVRGLIPGSRLLPEAVMRALGRGAVASSGVVAGAALRLAGTGPVYRILGKVAPLGWVDDRTLLANIGTTLARRDASLAPLVYEVVMKLKEAEVEQLVQRIVNGVLDTYVYTRYKSSGGGGMLCGLCGRAACSSTAKSGKANADAGPRLASNLQRAFRAVNTLLDMDPRRLTVTIALYKAMESNLSPVARNLLHVAGKLHLPTFAAMVAIPLYPVIIERVQKFGLSMDRGAFSTILWKHFPSIVRPFITGDMRVSIEPLLIDLVKNSKPLGLVAGLASGVAGNGRATSQFCAMCSQSCG